jgi:hypothetical protein
MFPVTSLRVLVIRQFKSASGAELDEINLLNKFSF